MISTAETQIHSVLCLLFLKIGVNWYLISGWLIEATVVLCLCSQASYKAT